MQDAFVISALRRSTCMCTASDKTAINNDCAKIGAIYKHLMHLKFAMRDLIVMIVAVTTDRECSVFVYGDVDCGYLREADPLIILNYRYEVGGDRCHRCGNGRLAADFPPGPS